VTEKIAISVDADLLEAVEALRQKTDESRSAVFVRAVRMLLRNEERRRRVEEYVDAYRRQPETEAELAEAEALARMSLPSAEWDA
jgi:metal-responsive CopG/Arc/MetJ family transcriptional regulator